MPATSAKTSYTCMRCLRAYRKPEHAFRSQSWRRQFSSSSPLGSGDSTAPKMKEEESTIEERTRKGTNEAQEEVPLGAMSRRLQAATEEILQEGGRAGRKAVEEAGFSEELKDRLLEKIEQQRFRSENAAAFAEAGLTSAAGAGSRNIATAPAWAGAESTEDSVLRMLNDAHKPLRKGLRGSPQLPIVDLRIKRAPKRTSGQILANARNKTSVYASAKDVNLSEKEREEMRRDLKDRFGPGVRAMPNSIRGLQALANERIEDAIARGQFKNIPRGKGVVRDVRADNPFIDTTEYIMNKMIQRQDIVPPWIEKQQELVKAARVFRARLRNDWKRHAARTISSRGGSLQEQMKTADRYAQAEIIHNPKVRAVEQISVPTNKTDDPVMVTISSTPSEEISPVPVTLENKNIEITISDIATSAMSTSPIKTVTAPSDLPQSPDPLPSPLRDPSWEQSEHSYLTLAIKNLNSLTRTYNLMCPDLAKKPYYNLDRELKMMYADVAPTLAETIRERALRPAKPLVDELIPRNGGSVLERFALEDRAKIWDERRPQYGLKDFWRDLWSKG